MLFSNKPAKASFATLWQAFAPYLAYCCPRTMSSGADSNDAGAAIPDKRARTAVITQAVNALVGEHEASQRQRKRSGRKDENQKKLTARSRSTIKERTLNRLVLLAKDNNDK